MSKDVIKYALQPILDALAEEEEENNTRNTVGTRNAFVCPHCFVSDGSLGNKYRVEGEVICPSCRKNYLIRHFVVVEYSTFKIEDNNE